MECHTTSTFSQRVMPTEKVRAVPGARRVCSNNKLLSALPCSDSGQPLERSNHTADQQKNCKTASPTVMPESISKEKRKGDIGLGLRTLEKSGPIALEVLAPP
jgi:hypothetical protein